MRPPRRRVFGKYRGRVESNVDPDRMGRIQVSVPSVLGKGRLSWAMPCVPYAGRGIGFLAVPPMHANVWVEFEEGDTDHPIWSGCFWTRGDAPEEHATPFVKVFKTEGVTLVLDDTPGGGGLTVRIEPPAVGVPITIACTASGVEIGTGTSRITLDGSAVAVNDGALEVR